MIGFAAGKSYVPYVIVKVLFSYHASLVLSKGFTMDLSIY